MSVYVDNNGVTRNEAGQSLGDILAQGPLDPGADNTTIIDPVTALPQEEPGIIEGLGIDATGSLEDAMDPFGLFHTSDAPASGGGTLSDSIKTFSGQLGAQLGSALGWALVLGVGYLVVRSELTRRTPNTLS